MKIQAISVVFPTQRVTNKDIINLIRKKSEDIHTDDIEKTLARVEVLLKGSGAKERYWLKKGEKPINFIKQAITSSLHDAKLKAEDIDLMIYVGVGKGFLEPAQSYLVAKALGWESVECFDILDACMSWMRALYLSENLLKSGCYRNILVINGEFINHDGVYLRPGNWALKHMDELYWTFPTYTIGSAATATILTAEKGNEWSWEFISRPELAELCTIPNSNWKNYSGPSEKIGRNGEYRFTSFGSELHHNGIDYITKLSRNVIEKGDVKHLFSHASSFREWNDIFTSLGVEDRAFYVYPEYGNLVSASVPAGLALKIQQGKIARGDRTGFVVGSAGMSFASAVFDF